MSKKNTKYYIEILWMVLFILYLVILFRITVFRAGFSFEDLLENGTINITLFQGYISILEGGHWVRFIYLFIGNIIWFVPFGAYLQYQKKFKKIGAIVLLGFFLSLLQNFCKIKSRKFSFLWFSNPTEMKPLP